MSLPGFTAVERPGATLFVRPGLEEETDGLADPALWERQLASAGEGGGRGAVARVPVGGRPAVLKRMRRGGLLARWRGDRFSRPERLRRNAVLPDEAIRRGVPTPPVLALLVVEVPGGYRGWLAVEEIRDALPLSARITEEIAAAALSCVRKLHDAGIVHPDLNLGNLLARAGDSGVEAFVVDLDGARVSEDPAPFAARRNALRRIERSYEKVWGRPGPVDTRGGALWYDLYAETDPPLRRRLEAGRPWGRFLLALHRAGWRRRDG